jgi:hypothetical protein
MCQSPPSCLRILNRMHELVPSAVLLAGEVLIDGEDAEADPASSWTLRASAWCSRSRRSVPRDVDLRQRAGGSSSSPAPRADRDRRDYLVGDCLTKADSGRGEGSPSRPGRWTVRRPATAMYPRDPSR